MISAIGINHKTAPVAVREKLAFNTHEIPNVLAYLKKHTDAKELALVSTCNRTEFYGIQATPGSLFQGWMAYRSNPLEVKPHVYHHCDEPAVHHLMRVASGLDSMVLGEPQILNQLKVAYELAHEQGSIGPHLEQLFQKTFRVAKQVRSETAIGQYPVSVAYSAVKLAKQIFSDISKARVLLIGAGETVELVAQHLQSQNVIDMTFTNRTFERAQGLCERYSAKVMLLEDLPRHWMQYDIVISAIEAHTPILTKADLHPQQKRHPIFMVDLGMPRNFCSELTKHEDIYLYDLDDIHKVIDHNIHARADEALRADAIIKQQANNYMLWLDAKSAYTVLINSRQKAMAIKEELVAKALIELESGHAPEQVVEFLAHRLTQKLLHNPSKRLKKAGRDKDETFIKAASELLHFE